MLSRAAIPMLAMAKGIQVTYRQDPNSALPGDIFSLIVQDTCLEYLQKQSQGPAAPFPPVAPHESVLFLEDFLEYFRELLVGERLVGRAGALLRSLRPWSTALTHNLIRGLCNCANPFVCNSPETPEVTAIRNGSLPPELAAMLPKPGR